MLTESLPVESADVSGRTLNSSLVMVRGKPSCRTTLDPSSSYSALFTFLETENSHDTTEQTCLESITILWDEGFPFFASMVRKQASTEAIPTSGHWRRYHRV